MFRLDHVVLQVADMDAAIKFYTKKFGLSLVADELDEENHERTAWFYLDGSYLQLRQALNGNNEPVPYEPPAVDANTPPVCAFAIPDIAELMMRVERKKIPIVKGIREVEKKKRTLTVKDPDNNVIQFIQWLEPYAPPEEAPAADPDNENPGND